MDTAARWREPNSILKSSKVRAEFIEPMQCLLVNKLPEGKQWECELKLEMAFTSTYDLDGKIFCGEEPVARLL